MPYRPATVTQADIARVIRAYRAAGIENVRVRLTADGPVIEPATVPDPSASDPPEEPERSIVV